MSLATFIKTTPRYIKLLEAEGISTPRQLLEYFPRDYEDRQNLVMLDTITPETTEKVISKVKIIEKKIIPTKFKQLGQLTVEDEAGNQAQILFSRAMYAFQKIELNKRYTIIGKPKAQGRKVVFRHPEISTAHAQENTIAQNI